MSAEQASRDARIAVNGVALQVNINSAHKIEWRKRKKFDLAWYDKKEEVKIRVDSWPDHKDEYKVIEQVRIPFLCLSKGADDLTLRSSQDRECIRSAIFSATTRG